ncbi:MAG: hypothetical protein E7672_01000 [Ruminococcaceae bacterium]|nr:hypothetical protein [Oscillospiraceae bacterium]
MGRQEQLFRIAHAVTDDDAVSVKYTEYLEMLFDAVDPKRVSGDFLNAIAADDYSTAVLLLAAYYRGKPDIKIPSISSLGTYNVETADLTARGIMKVVNVEWSFPDGEVDFLFDPTEIKGPRNNEWVWQFNRNSYWVNMARTYTATADEKYAVAFQKQLLKWIAQTYIPENWNSRGSTWRTIECGLRLSNYWSVAFDAFKKSNSVHDVTLLLMVASMYHQSKHLISHPTKGNWLMMEMNGVFTFSVIFNEMIYAESNRRLAAEYLLKALKQQTLPDGMHNELTPDYQRVVFDCACNFYEIAVNYGFESDISGQFVELMRKTVDTAIMLSTPAFTQPRTNETSTTKTTLFTGRAEKLLGKRPEYSFVNTKRLEGNPPMCETASVFLEYAGFAVMRSDWGPDAAYICFDVGPLGMAHIHQDKLNINLYKGGEELIYDDGGGEYEISPARVYSKSGYSHNILLVDGIAQRREVPLQSDEPIDADWITNSEFDYASAVYDETYGEEFSRPAVWKREIRFCKPDFFCVADTISSSDGKAHDYEILFHLDTTKVNLLSDFQNGVISDYGRKYDVAIIPLDDDSADVELKTVSAVTEPQFQGWFNGRNDTRLHEAITVSREVKNAKNYRFVTILFPITSNGELPVIKKEDNNVTVFFNCKEHTIDLDKLNK